MSLMDITVFPNLDPRVVVVDAPQTEATLQDIVDTIEAWQDSEEGISFSPLIDPSGKQALGGGTSVVITATLLNTKLRFAARHSPLTTGIATAASSTGKILEDTGNDFVSAGIYVGCTIFNGTAGAMETVVLVSTNTLTSFPLQGGTRQDWQIGDTYSIYPNNLCNISGGNLVAVDENGDEMDPILQAPNVNIVRASSSSGTVADLEAIQYASFQNAVWYDPTSANSGTEFPNGTREFPSNNIPDIVIIAGYRGFDTIQLLKSVTIDGVDIQNFRLIGSSHVHTSVTLEDSTLCNNVTIENCNVTGVLDGGVHITRCMAGNLTYVNGHIHDTGLYGNFMLAGNEDAVFANCFTVDQDDPPIIDMGSSGQDLAMPNYAGLLTVRNLVSADNEVGIGLNAGAVILDSSITAGTIIVSGVGNLTDNSMGTAIVDSTALLNAANIGYAVWEDDLINSHSPGSMGDAFVKLMGLVHQNSFLDNTEHDANNQLTSARLRCFDTKANADAATDGGSETTGLLNTYTISAEYDGETLKSYRMTLNP